MKRILLTSLVLVIISVLMFAPVYLSLIYTAETKAQDYSDDVVGSWNVFQFYKGNERVACNEETYMNLTICDNTISITGTVLTEAKTTFVWNSGTTLSYEANGEAMQFFVSFDSQNNLKITTADGEYILLLRREEG